MVVEKKENKVEKAKRERDGLDCYAELRRYAREGFGSISEDDLNVRLRWYGLYTQRPQEDGYFMLRVKIPNGTLSSEQLETLGNISIRYGQNTGDITTRQDIQFHYIRIEDVPEIFETLDRVGLSTSGACGDITRNVTGCPLAGIDAAEFFNAEPLVDHVHYYFLGNHEFSNLPRKFKITISGCSQYCTGHEINDIGLIAVDSGNGKIMFDLWAGGGLGAKERFAERLGVYIHPTEVVEVCHHICNIFREYGNRNSRALARMKFLMADWGPDKFRAELENRLGRSLTPGDAPSVPYTANRAHIGIHQQKQPGLVYVGAASKGGLFFGSEMTRVARIAREHGGGRVRLTPAQNLILLDVPEKNAQLVSRQLAAIDFRTESSSFRTGTIACTGKQFCKLALTETKARAEEIINHLETTLPGFRNPLRISVTGCPNSCAHYQICDIGLVGDFLNTPQGKIEAFRVYLGGHLGDGHRFGRELDNKIPATEVKFYIENIARSYLAERLSIDEGFHEFLARKTVSQLETLGSPSFVGVSA